MHYFKFNISDWSLSTNHLTFEEEFVYFRLVTHYYHTEEPLSLDIKSLCRRLRISDKAEIAETVLDEFFEKTDEGYINERCEIELEAYKRMSRKNKANGAKGGRPKKPQNQVSTPEITQTNSDEKSEETQRKPSGLPDENPEETQNNLNQEPLTINQELLTNKQNNKNIHVEKAPPSQVKPAASPPETIKEIFSHWTTVMGKNARAKLTDKRKRCIQARLKEGYSVEDIKHAIDGCARSAYHMGQNDSGTVYDCLTLICRSGEKVEQFMSNIAKITNDPQGGNPVNQPRPTRRNKAYTPPQAPADDAAKRAVSVLFGKPVEPGFEIQGNTYEGEVA